MIVGGPDVTMWHARLFIFLVGGTQLLCGWLAVRFMFPLVEGGSLRRCAARI